MWLGRTRLEEWSVNINHKYMIDIGECAVNNSVVPSPKLKAVGVHFRQEFPEHHQTGIKDKVRAAKFLFLLTKGKRWSLLMPSTKSFTLVKSTLFLPLELTPPCPSERTWPWLTPEGRKKKAKTPLNVWHTRLCLMPSNHDAVHWAHTNTHTHTHTH